MRSRLSIFTKRINVVFNFSFYTVSASFSPLPPSLSLSLLCSSALYLVCLSEIEFISIVCVFWDFEYPWGTNESRQHLFALFSLTLHSLTVWLHFRIWTEVCYNRFSFFSQSPSFYLCSDLVWNLLTFALNDVGYQFGSIIFQSRARWDMHLPSFVETISGCLKSRFH